MSEINDSLSRSWAERPALWMLGSPEDDEQLVFLDEEEDDEVLGILAPWQILVVDDEPQVHETTLLALKNARFAGRPCFFLHAYSAAQALELIASRPGIDLVLLDVVMETRDAGLRLVRELRASELQPDMKIVIRSGQPGYASEAQVMRDYPVDAYIHKTRQTRSLLTETLSGLLGGARS